MVKHAQQQSKDYLQLRGEKICNVKGQFIIMMSIVSLQWHSIKSISKIQSVKHPILLHLSPLYKRICKVEMVITTKIYNVTSAMYAIEHPDWLANHYHTLLYLCLFNLKISKLSPDTDKYLHKRDNSHADMVPWQVLTGHRPGGHQSGVRLKDLYLNTRGWRSYRALQQGFLISKWCWREGGRCT